MREQIHGLKHAIQLKTQLPKRIQVEQELLPTQMLVLIAWDLHKLEVNLNLIMREQIHGLKHVTQLKTQQLKRIQVEQEPLPIQMLVLTAWDLHKKMPMNSLKSKMILQAAEQIHGLLNAIHPRIQSPKKIQVALELMKIQTKDHSQELELTAKALLKNQILAQE
jgi:hypothetical protein